MILLFFVVILFLITLASIALWTYNSFVRFIIQIEVLVFLSLVVVVLHLYQAGSVDFSLFVYILVLAGVETSVLFMVGVIQRRYFGFSRLVSEDKL